MKFKDHKVFVAALTVLAMIATLAGCDAAKKASKKAEIDEKEVEEMAEDISKALISLDSKKIYKAIPDLKDSTKEIVEGLEFEDGAKEVYDAWFDTFNYEVGEVDVNEDEAVVDVEFKYVDVASLEAGDITSDEMISAIKDAKKDGKLEISMSFSYDEDEEEVVLDSGDKTVKKFYDLASTYIPVNSFVFYDDSMSGSWSKEKYDAKDKLEFTVEFKDIKDLNGKTINVTLIDASYKEVYKATIEFKSGKTADIVISPKDIKADAFADGFYSLEFEDDDATTFFSSSVRVEAAKETTAAVTIPDASDATETTDTTDKTEPSETTDETKETTDATDATDTTETTAAGSVDASKIKGTFDESSKVYTNEYFNFKLKLTDSMVQMDPEAMGMAETNGAIADFVVLENMDSILIVTLYPFDGVPGGSKELYKQSFAASDDAGENVTLAGIEFTKTDAVGQGSESWVAFEDDAMLMITVSGMNSDSNIDNLVKVVESMEKAK